MADATASLDLYENHNIAASGDYVYLTITAAVIALKNLIAALLKMTAGPSLAGAASALPRIFRATGIAIPACFSSPREAFLLMPS